MGACSGRDVLVILVIFFIETSSNHDGLAWEVEPNAPISLFVTISLKCSFIRVLETRWVHPFVCRLVLNLLIEIRIWCRISFLQGDDGIRFQINRKTSPWMACSLSVSIALLSYWITQLRFLHRLHTFLIRDKGFKAEKAYRMVTAEQNQCILRK